MEYDKEMLDLGIALGQNHAFGLIAGRCSAAQAETLRRVREEKVYLKCSSRWDEFCPKYIGMSSAQADRVINLLEEFGPKYFSVAQLTRISAETYRAIEPAVKDGAIECKGEVIELAPENTRKLARAVAELRREAEPKVEKKPPEPAAAPDRIADLNRRFEELFLEALMLPVEDARGRARLHSLLQSQLLRLIDIVRKQAA